MSDTISVSITRSTGSDQSGSFFFDTSRAWDSPISVSITRETGTDQSNSLAFDTSRVWDNPISVSVNRQTGTDQANAVEFPASRVWGAPLAVSIKRETGSDQENQEEFPTFRIVNETLANEKKTLYMDRTIIAPPGVPWLYEETTTAAWCCKITRADGTVFGFTNHDRNIVYNGLTYKANSGFTPTTVDTSNNMAVDNLDIEGAISSEIITTQDLEEGRYDNATIEVFLCNWSKLTDPVLILRRGTIGEVSPDVNAFTAEVRGLLDAYQQTSKEIYQKVCRANLGDSRCKVDLTGKTVTGTVTQINADGTFNSTLSATLGWDGYYDYGKLTWTSGRNSGNWCEVKSYKYTSNSSFQLQLPTYWPVTVGDTFTVSAGCDGNFSTCRIKWNNVNNFRGHPHVPGNDYSTGYATNGTSNTTSG